MLRSMAGRQEGGKEERKKSLFDRMIFLLFVIENCHNHFRSFTL